nr:hypothetical protein [Tanacetum cinerariifolium]
NTLRRSHAQEIARLIKNIAGTIETMRRYVFQFKHSRNDRDHEVRFPTAYKADDVLTVEELGLG